MADTLTARQREVYDLLLAHQRRKGRPATLRAVGDAMGIRSTNGVHDHLVALERKGYVRRDAGGHAFAIDDWERLDAEERRQAVFAIEHGVVLAHGRHSNEHRLAMAAIARLSDG